MILNNSVRWSFFCDQRNHMTTEFFKEFHALVNSSHWNEILSYLSCSLACLFSCHSHSFSWSIYLLPWWATPTQELPKSKMNGWDRYIVQYNRSFDIILPQAWPNFYSFHIRQWIVGKNCLDCGARHLSRREIEAAKPLFRENGYRRKGLGSQANHVGRYLVDKKSYFF